MSNEEGGAPSTVRGFGQVNLNGPSHVAHSLSNGASLEDASSSAASSEKVPTVGVPATATMLKQLQSPSQVYGRRGIWSQRIAPYATLWVLLSQFCMACLFQLADPDAYVRSSKRTTSYSPEWAHVVIIVVATASFAMVAAVNVHLLSRIRTTYITTYTLLNLYLSVIAVFCSIYWACFLAKPISLAVEGIRGKGSGDSERSNHFTVWLTMLYFSTATMTTTGFGDVTTSSWHTELAAAVQMLIAMAYTLGIFAIGISHVQSQQNVRLAAKARGINVNINGTIPERNSTDRRGVIRGGFAYFRQRFPWINTVRRFVIRYLLVISVLWQGLCLLLLNVADSSSVMNRDASTMAVAVMIIGLQIVFITGIVLISFRVIHKTGSSEGVTIGFLVQSYLSTTLAFGGAFFLVYLLNGKDSFVLTTTLESTGEADATKVVFRLMFLSIACITTTGYGELYALSVVPRVIITVEMLISVFYAVVILGHGMSRYIMKVQVATRRRHRYRAPTEKAVSAGGSRHVSQDAGDLFEEGEEPGERQRSISGSSPVDDLVVDEMVPVLVPMLEEEPQSLRRVQSVYGDHRASEAQLPLMGDVDGHTSDKQW